MKKQLSILLVFALLFSTFGSAQFGFDQTNGFEGGDPYGPQQATGPGFGPQGGQGFNQGPSGFGFGEAFNSVDPFASDIGGGEQLVTLKIYNTLFKAIYTSRDQFNETCLEEGGEQRLIDQIRAAYEENKPAIQEICNRYEERLASFSQDICDVTKAFSRIPAPPEIQAAAAEAGIEFNFDITASQMETLCKTMAGKEISKEQEFQNKRFEQEAQRFLDECSRRQEMDQKWRELDEQRRQMDDQRWQQEMERMKQGYNQPYQQGPYQQGPPQDYRPPEGQQQQQPFCGDGMCNEDPNSCQQDCGQQIFCGDGMCNEDPSSCPTDCGGGGEQGGGDQGGGEGSGDDGGGGEGGEGGLAAYNYNYAPVYFQESPPENTQEYVEDFYGPEIGAPQPPFGEGFGPGYGPPQGQPFGDPSQKPYGEGFGPMFGNSGPVYGPPEGFGPSGQQGPFGPQPFGGPNNQGGYPSDGGFGGPSGGYGPQGPGGFGGGPHMGPFSEDDCSSDTSTLVEKMKSQGDFGPTDEMLGAMCKRMGLEMSEKFSQFKEQAELQKENCELNMLRKKTALEEAVSTCNGAIESSKATQLIEKTVRNRCQLVRLKEQRQAQLTAEVEAALGLYEIAENTGNQVVEASALDIVEKDKEYQQARQEKVNIVSYIFGSPEFAKQTDEIVDDLEERKKDLEDVSGTLGSSEARELEDEIEKLDEAIEQKRRIVESHKSGILGIFGRLGQ